MAKAIIQQQVDYLEVFRKSLIGVPMTFVAQEVPDAFMICDGSLVLFEDWPEFKEAYDAGKFSGMVLDSADSANAGKFVKKDTTGLYLPDTVGLYEQSSSAANAGGYLAAGIPDLIGSFVGLLKTGESTIDGVFFEGGQRLPTIMGGDGLYVRQIGFRASMYNKTYTDQVNTVQPPSVQYVRAMYLGKPNAAAA